MTTADELPTELVSKIFSYLGFKEALMTVGLVSKRWHAIAIDYSGRLIMTMDSMHKINTTDAIVAGKFNSRLYRNISFDVEVYNVGKAFGIVPSFDCGVAVSNLSINLRNIDYTDDPIIQLSPYDSMASFSFKMVPLRIVISKRVSLTTLVLNNASLRRVPFLPRTMEYLDLSSNMIESMETMEGYPTSLAILILDFNSLTKIDAVYCLRGSDGPRNLVEMSLASNRIEKIENISSTVRNLILASNRIKRIENIPMSCIQLNLFHNPIELVRDIPNSVVDLVIGPCNAMDFTHLPARLIKLVMFNVHVNEIAFPPTLEHISIRNSVVADRHICKHLKSVKNLRIVSILGTFLMATVVDKILLYAYMRLNSIKLHR